MGFKPEITHSGKVDFNDPEVQVWPVTATVLIAAAASAGVIAARGDFGTPDLVNNAWSRLSLLMLLAAIALYTAYSLRGRVLMRVQVALLATILLHFFALTAMNEYKLAIYTKEPPREKDPLPDDAPPMVIDYGVPVEQLDLPTADPLEELLDVKTPDDVPPQPIRERPETLVEREAADQPVVAPRTPERQPTPTHTPQAGELDRAMPSRPRAAEELAGESITRREQAAPDPFEQSLPRPETQPVERPADAPDVEARSSVARRDSVAAPTMQARSPAGAIPTLAGASDAPRRSPGRGDFPGAPAPGPSQIARQTTPAERAAPSAAPAPAPPAPAAAPQASATAAARTASADSSAPDRASGAGAMIAPQTTVVAAQPSQAQRTSAPATPQTPAPSPVPRAAGAPQAAPASSEAPTPASLAATESSETNVEAAPTAIARAQPGAGGTARTRNFSNELPNAPTRSSVASTSSARSSTRTAPADSAPGPSSTSLGRRSVTGADAPASMAAPTASPVPDALASRTPGPTESSASAARRSAAGNAPLGTVQVSAGVGPVDLGAPAYVAPAEGLSRGAASPGGGDANVAASSQAAKLGRATQAGETHAAGDSSRIAQMAVSSGSDPNRVVGPQVDSNAANVARSQDGSGAGVPGSTRSGAGTKGRGQGGLGDGAAVGSSNVARATTGGARGTGDGNSTGPVKITRADGAPNGTGDGPGAAPVALAGNTPGGRGTAPTGEGFTPGATGVGIARQATGGADMAGAPRPGGAGGVSGLGRGVDLAGSGAGARNPLGESDEIPAIGGEGTGGGLERASAGGRGGIGGDDPGAQVAAASAPSGRKNDGDGEGMQAGGLGVGRRAAGVEVDVAGPSGEGGLTLTNPGELGLPDRRARRDSTLANFQIARFVLEKSGGRRGAADPGEAVPTYMLRERQVRSQVAEQFGGSKESEEAVELGLAFLAGVQQPDGSWTLHNWPGEPRGDQALSARNRRNSETAGTGLALLAFLGAGYDHTDGPYQQTVRRGLDWLIRKQKEDGDLFTGGDDPEIRMYAHGIAAIPLCEAFAMSRDPELQEPVRKALQFTLKAQDLKWGGWRYQPGRQADTSVTGWQMMSLKSGELSGFGVPPAAYEGVTKWLDFAARGPEGNRLSRYAYLPATNAREASDRIPNPAMTAESLLMRLYLGWDRQHPALQGGADYLLQNLPPTSLSDTSRRDCYYWYYGTQVMYQMQGRHWKGWNDRLRPLLIDTQVKQGDFAGSWDPRGDKWGEQGGRLYVTCMHLLMLEVYYRHLPLFRLDDGVQADATK